MNAVDTYRAFRARVHRRVCASARTCTCPDQYDGVEVEDARGRARAIHEKFAHPGPVEACQSPDDVICKAVFP